jgi:hypothetical protein
MRSDMEVQPPNERHRRQPGRLAAEPERGPDEAEAVEAAAPARRSKSKLASPDPQPTDEVSSTQDRLPKVRTPLVLADNLPICARTL